MLFQSDTTLEGLKLNVYVIIKILKFCTGSSAKSYQCKFAINSDLNRIVTPGELGSVIKKVIHHYTLRGKFSSVHPELRREGIVRVEVGEEGLCFVWDTGKIILPEKALENLFV